MILLLMILVVFCGVSMGEVYNVGDSNGWTDIGHFDYKSWSATKNFRVGDSIVFKYNKQFHNVVRVTHKNFNACNGSTTYGKFNSGNDTYLITKPGHFYFICSLPGHCQNGQRVDIRVPNPTNKPSPSPSPSPSRPTPSASPSTPSNPTPSASPSPSKPTPAAPSPSKQAPPVSPWKPTPAAPSPSVAPAPAPTSSGAKKSGYPQMFFSLLLILAAAML